MSSATMSKLVGIFLVDGSREVPRYRLNRRASMAAAAAELNVRELAVGPGSESRNQECRDRVTLVIEDDNDGAALCVPV